MHIRILTQMPDHRNRSSQAEQASPEKKKIKKIVKGEQDLSNRCFVLSR